MTEQNHGACERWHAVSAAAAVVYLLLLPCCIPLRGPLFAHDLMAPLFLVLVALRKETWRELVSVPAVLAAAFLGLATVATLCHWHCRADTYELGIFAYMVLLCFFFRTVRLTPRLLLLCGLLPLVLFTLWTVAALLSGTNAVHEVYRESALGFLGRRLVFRFSHPNLAASYYVLPVICVLLGYTLATAPCGTVATAGAVVALALLCVPLLFTVSRHLLLTFAAVLGYFLGRVRAPSRRLLGIGAMSLLSLFGVFLLTVFFPFFPLSRSFPFFNAATPGMYCIHQEIYLRMVFVNVKAFVVGVGRSGVHELYPQLAQPDRIEQILAQYRMPELAGPFSTYMDAHNEYLNLATAFGVPAMFCCFAFWVAAATSVPRSAPRRSLVLCYVTAVLMVSFWDDILSKRWIWAGLGLLLADVHNPGSAARRNNPHGPQCCVPMPQ